MHAPLPNTSYGMPQLELLRLGIDTYLHRLKLLPQLLVLLLQAGAALQVLRGEPSRHSLARLLHLRQPLLEPCHLLLRLRVG